MTKAELKARYLESRGKYAAGELWTNEYALHLDTMLAKYFNIPFPDHDTEVIEVRRT
jgi:hypothetical protein